MKIVDLSGAPRHALGTTELSYSYPGVKYFRGVKLHAQCERFRQRIEFLLS